MEENPRSIYQFKARLINGKEKQLSDYKGKVVLLVNIATACGFSPQLKELQELKDSLDTEDFEVLAFPSNDFGGQEPLDGEAITSHCELNYGVKFPVFAKIMVRGEQANPIFKFLSSKELNGHFKSVPRWNFHKYLIGRDGELVDYFFPFTKPMSSKVRKKIQRLL
jgi:glutathione peroxidase